MCIGVVVKGKDSMEALLEYVCDSSKEGESIGKMWDMIEDRNNVAGGVFFFLFFPCQIDTMNPSFGVVKRGEMK